MTVSRNLDGLVGDLRESFTLTSRQQENIVGLIKLSENFYSRLGLEKPPGSTISPDSIILESGHQPNFIPHCGTLKKAYLLSWIQRKLTAGGRESIAFFGFADQNLSTAKYLYRNYLPAINNDGFDVVGFKIEEKDRLKSFNVLEKPPEQAWQREMDRIRNLYSGYAKKVPGHNGSFPIALDSLLETLWKSYEPAENFAELNAFIYARICHDLLGFDLRFFMYSDLQREMLFLDESKRLLNQLPAYNQAYNRIIREKNLPIPTVAMDHLPFWFNCSCGTKNELVVDESFTAYAICPNCKEKHTLNFGENFNNLGEFYRGMDFTAVSRNLIVSQGIGDSLFIPGAGGSMQYGAISDEIAHAFDFNQPMTLSWRSTDYYLGFVHTIVLQDLMKAASCNLEDLQGVSLPEKVSGKLQILSAEVARSESGQTDKKIQKAMKNNLRQFTNLTEAAKKIFSSTPSALDILMCNDHRQISALWDEACEKTLISSDGRLNRMEENIVYPNPLFQELVPDALPGLYRSIKGLEISYG